MTTEHSITEHNPRPEVRTMVAGPTRASEAGAMPDTADVQPGTCVPFIAPDRDDDAGLLDAVAGCEFVDDRIRLPE